MGFVLALFLSHSPTICSASINSTAYYSSQGCCSSHGGISHCGYTTYGRRYICNDGAISSCGC